MIFTLNTKCFILIFLLSILSIDVSFAQYSYEGHNFAKADSIAISVTNHRKKYKEVDELTLNLVRELDDPVDRYRAIVKWVSLNVEYKLGAKNFKGKDVLKRREAVCAGYANLVKEMCDYAGIPCEVVSGAANNTYGKIGAKVNYHDHAWNVVKLDGKWIQSDPTWTTSSYNEEEKEYNYKFNEHYFLADPYYFNKTHLPEDDKWQLTSNPIKKKEFKNAPIFYPVCEDSKVYLSNKQKGITKNKLRLKHNLNSPKKGVLIFELEDAVYQIQSNKSRRTKKGYTFLYKTKGVPSGTIIWYYVEGCLVFGGKIK